VKIPSRWLAALGIAMSLPSAILTIGWLSMKLVENDILTKKEATLSFVILTSSMLFLMVWYGIKRKN
jgi:hypothetical protein